MKIFFTLLFLFVSTGLFAQRSKKKLRKAELANTSVHIDSMYVHLYTDSLKKGTYNYINVDGKLDNGKFIPLDSSEVNFSANYGKFYGNSLFIDGDFDKEKVTIEVELKKDPAQNRTFDLYIKKAPDPELKSENEIIERIKKSNKKRN